MSAQSPWTRGDDLEAPTFAEHEIEFLAANEMSRQRWLCDSNAAPLLHELRDRGLMQPAMGEFGPPRDKGESVNLLGRAIPVMELISLYMLTPLGKQEYSAAIRNLSAKE